MNDPSSLLREARKRAGLSQRVLAQRAGTSQSVVARIEAGLTSPSWRTLESLLAAAGCDLRAALTGSTVTGTHMLDDVARILRLTPAQRLAELRNLSSFVSGARRVP